MVVVLTFVIWTMYGIDNGIFVLFTIILIIIMALNLKSFRDLFMPQPYLNIVYVKVRENFLYAKIRNDGWADADSVDCEWSITEQDKGKTLFTSVYTPIAKIGHIPKQKFFEGELRKLPQFRQLDQSKRYQIGVKLSCNQKIFKTVWKPLELDVYRNAE